MNSKRKVDVFSAGCPVCEDAVDLVQNLACPSCDVTVLDINDPDVAHRAQTLGIRSIPAFFFFENGDKASDLAGANPPALKKAVESLSEKAKAEGGKVSA